MAIPERSGHQDRARGYAAILHRVAFRATKAGAAKRPHFAAQGCAAGITASTSSLPLNGFCSAAWAPNRRATRR